MDSSELQEIIRRLKLQAMLIGCSIVFLVILLAFIQVSLIWLPCNDLCPPMYDEFVASLGFSLRLSKTESVLNYFFYQMYFMPIAGGLLTFRILTTRLDQELRRWIIKADLQQVMAAVAALQLQRAQAKQYLLIGSDGELMTEGEEIATDHQIEATLKHVSDYAIMELAVSKRIVKSGIESYLRDVIFALHTAMVIGCVLFVIAWWIGYPTDNWARFTDFYVMFAFIPGMVLGVALAIRYVLITWHWAQRESQLGELIDNLQYVIQERLEQAGLKVEEKNLDALLGELKSSEELNADDLDTRLEQREPRQWNQLHVPQVNPAHSKRLRSS